MFFSVQELEHHKIHFDTTFPADELEFFEKLRQSGPIHAKGSAELLRNTLGEIRIQGHVAGEMEAECDRCLETFKFSLDSRFDLFYRPAETAPITEETRIDEGESEIGFYEGNGVQLEDVLREHILLNLPMQRICSDACKGICPACGQNRNRVYCDCEVKTVDERWSALKNL